MNLAGETPKKPDSFSAIFLLMGRRPRSMRHMFCLDTPPIFLPSSDWLSIASLRSIEDVAHPLSEFTVLSEMYSKLQPQQVQQRGRNDAPDLNQGVVCPYDRRAQIRDMHSVTIA
jgi:hypothetical protein